MACTCSGGDDFSSEFSFGEGPQGRVRIRLEDPGPPYVCEHDEVPRPLCATIQRFGKHLPASFKTVVNGGCNYKTLDKLSDPPSLSRDSQQRKRNKCVFGTRLSAAKRKVYVHWKPQNEPFEVTQYGNRLAGTLCWDSDLPNVLE